MKSVQENLFKRGLTVFKKVFFRVFLPFLSILLILGINHPARDDTLGKLTPKGKFYEVVIVCAYRIMWLI